MEPNIEELKNFQNHWSLDELADNPSALKHVFETIISVAIAQQKEITELKQYISKNTTKNLCQIGCMIIQVNNL